MAMVSMKALALAAAVTVAAGAGHAATVASVDLVPFNTGGFALEIGIAGDYVLEFAGTSVFDDFLGFAAYSLDTGSVTPYTIYEDSSIDLGFLDIGTDFWGAFWAVGGPLTATLTLVDTPAPIPLPATLPLLAGALGAAAVVARRRKSAA